MSIIKHVTLQKIVAHDFRYDPRIFEEVQCTRHRDIQSPSVATTSEDYVTILVRVKEKNSPSGPERDATAATIYRSTN